MIEVLFFKLIFFMTCLSFVAFALDIGLNRHTFACDRQRVVFTTKYGVISNGNEYHKDSHCEWLIKAPNNYSSITLTFTKMDTECSYDHVFIYDGDSYTNPLLGSFSGNTTPSSVTATHGSMLILLYSDTNYVLTGFEAIFHVTDCPLNCSNNGYCKNHKCQCNVLWSGEACEINLCPNDCGISDGRGTCDLDGSYPIQCNCKPGYSGMDCSLPDSNKNSGNTWHIISISEIGSRAGHSGIYIKKTDSFYIFGGYTFREALGDTLVYSFTKNNWAKIQTAVSPSSRFAHAAVSYFDSFIIFGGELQNGSLSNELWIFNVSSVSWNFVDLGDNFIPPPLARHSVTLIDSQWLYVIGGSLSDGTFSSKMYRFNLLQKKWELLETYGNKEAFHRLVGHSAVYYEPIKTIFVFGGITAEYSHVSKLSNVMHAFHTEKKYWSEIEYPEDVHVAPIERAFHTAVIIGDYMIIYGGYTHRHSYAEVCYDNKTYLYHLRCHKWVDYSTLTADFIGFRNPISQGVFSHAMDVRRGHTLLISGGYSGNMRSELLAYIMPSVIYSDQHILNSCSRHKHMESCLSNLACGWCIENDLCIERKDKSCSKISAETCPGVCSVLNTCISCLIWGQSLIQNYISDRQEDHFSSVPCAWCVQDSKCHAVNDGDTTCVASNASVPISNTSSHSNGWWGLRGTDILNLNECYTKDSPPGVVSIKYKYPVNWSQPDQVTYLREASELLHSEFFRSEIQRNDSNGLGENVIKFIGFLHPLNAKPLSERIKNLKLAICSAGSSAILMLSNDSTSGHLEHVARHSMRASFDCQDAQRSKGASLFPHVNDGQKYMFDFTVRIPSQYNDSSKVELKWTAFSVELEVIQHKYLELYKNGSCSTLTNCLSCLTDALCGWCETTGMCYLKSNFSECINNEGSSFLVTEPLNCTVCSDHIYCEHCIQVNYCEWLVEAAICVRKGRYKIAVKSPMSCPMPCHLRTSCSTCLGDPGICAWCEELGTCFPFSIYTSLYSYGKCRDWVDENRAEHGDPTLLCRNCSRHINCSSCIRDLTCGWCSYAKHPLDGLCVEGDFSGSYSGVCPTLLKNETEPSDSHWLYANCPDLDECYWDLHTCHKNATCKNTPESYICECNLGFQGDGRNCIRACAAKCIHGFCSDAPDYKCICELGWTGDDCSVNCGCNNHSTCSRGLYICDECQYWTEGHFCERCRVGSYGYTQDTKGCQQCNCNGHGYPEWGFCNTTTGDCYCLHNTIGMNCEKCQEGYYGDPRNNGECFELCSPRKVITNATSGKFGSPAGSHHAEDCLWLLTVHSVLDMQSLLGPMEKTKSHLQISIYKDMFIPCPHNHVYIYDGLPNFVASGHPNVLLGAFCGSNLTNPIVATAVSGYLTVHFKRDSLSHGFNASYIRLQEEEEEISEYCLQNVTVEDNVTICLRNFCPKDCYSFMNQGYCDKIYRVCICEKGFGGEDCSHKLESYNLVWKYMYKYKNANFNDSLSNLPSGRFGHSLLSMQNKLTGKEDLWLYGGYSTVLGYLNDLFLYDTSNNQWIEIVLNNSPPPRHFHGAATSNGSLYIFGGLDENTVLGDFWEFSTTDHMWMQLPVIQLSNEIVTLAGCTLTAVNEEKLLLIGGFSPTYGFLEKVMEYDIGIKQWISLNTTGAVPVGFYGHTSVYHEPTQSIYIYGGVNYYSEHVSPSNFLYTFHYSSSQWFRLPPDSKVNSLKTRPLPRYFHASAVTENYLIIIGGRSEKSLKDSQPFAYVFSCNLWIPLKDAAIQVVGKWPEPIVGTAVATANKDIYFYGGSDGLLLKLSLPVDICHLFSANRIGCIHQTGCAFCSLSDNGKNQTICYAQDKHAESRCYNPTESKQFFTVTCNDEWLEKRDCHQYKSCSDCTASWPFYSRAKQVCRWCSNCRTGTCIPIDSSCNDASDCSTQKDVIQDPSLCPLRECAASDCQKCRNLDNCIWTRHVHRSGGYSHILNKNPVYNWSCVMKIQSAPSFSIDSMSPVECPRGCQQYNNCSSCLESNGGEGGWQHCVWSESKKLCISPTFEYLRCEDGSCGPVLRGNKSICPAPCWQHFQASHCLSQANCGWCAFAGPKVDGRGLCMNGGMMGPTGGICRKNQVILLGLPLPSQTLQWSKKSEGDPTWNYLTKPPENECENGHHNCDDAHEECVDTLEAFECRCKPGYKMIGKHCTPTCKQGCVNGTCVQPDICKCNFGFVGQNCSIKCKCNGHSNCPGVNEQDVCLECHNNTMGNHCEKCKPLFVGNPANGGKCVSCYDYCHTHSSTCISSDLLNSTFNQIQNQTIRTTTDMDTNAGNTGSTTGIPSPAAPEIFKVYELVEKMIQGPLDEAICIDCKNHTEGKRCDHCISGFFKAGEDLDNGCRPCECHGHGDTCNPLNGENCNCQNNTENDRQCSQKNMKNIMHLTPCWQLQCSKCKEYFLGSPSHGHQCYRHMFLDKDYCFNPGTIEECNRNPSPLFQGQTGFFAVQPRYMNVDIRIIVDVTKGGVDFFLSAKDDAFIVEVDKETGVHHIYIDEKYALDLKSYDITDIQSAVKTKRSIKDLAKESSNSTDTLSTEILLPTVANAQGLTTYIEVKKCEDFLLVRNLVNRLVVTIPQEVHDLRTTRFYMILRGTGEETYGNLFFRQDQTRIDLFVFFSVFFSCFFLFLAICVVVWKVKQAFDIRRQRRLHAAEMKHMASRPFGRIITVVDDEEGESDLFLYSPCNHRKKLKNMKVQGRDSPRQVEDKLCLRPLAVEPLSDGFGAIATILVQLPGGAQSLVRMSLASSLITSRSSPYHLGFNLRAAMRRRTSHANV